MPIFPSNKRAAGLTAEQMLEHLRTLQPQIPEFVQMTREEVKRIRRLVSGNVDFTREAVSAIGTSATVQGVIGNSSEEVHQAEDELARWTTVESELRSLLRGVVGANLVRRHRLFRAAQQVYHISRQLVREKEHADLLPHVEAMSRIRKLARRRPKPPAEPEPEME